MAALLALAAVAAVLALTLLPLLGDEAPVPDGTDAEALARERDEVVEALRDVDMDFAMGKLTEEDRDGLRAELEGRAVRILASLDAPSPPSGKGA